MAKLQVLQENSSIIGELELNDAFLATPYYPHLVRDSVVQYRAGLRQGTHATKTRGQVSGSNRKPWKQKGTGRARAGTTRSPLWRHGGIIFGPQPRDYSIHLNKKIRKKALQSVLAEKFRTGQIIIVDNLELTSHKTKSFAQTLAQLGCSKALIIVDQISYNLELASRNLENIHVLTFRSLNVYELLQYPKVVFVKNALVLLEKRLLS